MRDYVKIQSTTYHKTDAGSSYYSISEVTGKEKI